MTSTRDPRFHQYPYPEDDLDYDDEEEMDTDYQNAPPGGAGDARMAPPANTRRHCFHPLATYSIQSVPRSNSGITPEHSHRH